MAIQRTNYAESTGGFNSVTISYTTSSYYRGLLVAIQFERAASPPPNPTITFNGVSLTLIISQQVNSVGNGNALYYLTNPDLGTYNLVVSHPSRVISTVKIASYRNVSQSAFINASGVILDGSGIANVGLTSTVDDAWAFTYASGYSGTTDFTSGTNMTLLGSTNVYRIGDSNGGLGAAGAKTINLTAVGGGGGYFTALLAPAVTIPILNTLTYDNLAQTSVRALSEVLYDGDATITERGFVYNTVTLPTTANSKKVVTGTVGTYNADITGLTLNTTYYVRAYAINANGTAYSNEVTFTTLNIPQYELQYELGASDGDTYIGQINVTGTVGTITVKLGSTGTSTVINAGAGASAFTGTYSGLSGLIITRSADFNGTIDNVYYAKVPLGTTIDWTLNTVAITTSIPSEVFFKRVEDQIFNNFRFYRYLDLLFKDLDGYVTVTVRQEREDNTTEKSKVFVVGNTGSGTVSPFQKKRISFLCKDQAIIIGLSNDNLNETFSIAQYLLIGDKKPRRTISPSKIISIS